MIFVCVTMSVGLPEKQTYPGNPGCSCRNAPWGVFFRDATERIDGHRRSGDTRIVQDFEASRRSDDLPLDGFSEDGSEEDGVGAMATCDVYLGQIVAGYGDDGGRQVVFCVTSSNIAGAKGGVRGEMDPVGLDLKGNGRSGVENEARRGAFGGDYLQDFYCEFCLCRWEKVFFAELDKIDAAADPMKSVFKDLCLFLGLVACKEAAVGNGATEHVDKFSRRRKLAPLKPLMGLQRWLFEAGVLA
jgi:hypothetical protein